MIEARVPHVPDLSEPGDAGPSHAPASRPVRDGPPLLALVAEPPASAGRARPPIPIFAVALVSASTLLYGSMAGYYNRITRERIGDNRVRQRILAELQDSPGLRQAEIARRLGIHFTTVTHHVRLLQKWALLHPHASGRSVRYFPTGVESTDASRQRAVVLRRSGVRAFLEAAIVLPSFNAAEVARRLGIPRSTAAYHAKLLLEVGIVRRVEGGLAVAADAIPVLRKQGIGARGYVREEFVGVPLGRWHSRVGRWEDASRLASAIERQLGPSE